MCLPRASTLALYYIALLRLDFEHQQHITRAVLLWRAERMKAKSAQGNSSPRFLLSVHRPCAFNCSRAAPRRVSQAKEGKRMRPHPRPNIQHTCSPTYRQMPPCIGTRKMPRQPSSHAGVAADHSTHAWLVRPSAWT